MFRRCLEDALASKPSVISYSYTTTPVIITVNIIITVISVVDRISGGTSRPRVHL